MEELSGRGSRRPLGGADEKKGKVAAAEIVGKAKKIGKREEVF